MFATVLKQITAYFDQRALLSVFFPSLVFWTGALLTVGLVEHRTARVVQLWQRQPGLVQAGVVVGYLAVITFWSLLWQNAGEALDRLYQGHWPKTGPTVRPTRRAASRHLRARLRLIELDLRLEHAEAAAAAERAAFPAPESVVPAVSPLSEDTVDRELDALEALLDRRGPADPLTGWSGRCRVLAEQLAPHSETQDPRWGERLSRFSRAAEGLALALEEAELALREQRSTIHQQLFLRYPQPPVQPLPTRLGNVIRAAEQYPRIRYGLDPVVIWPRLQPVLPAEYADSMRTAKAGVDLLCTLAAYMCLFGLPLVVWVAARVSDPGEPLLVWSALVSGVPTTVALCAAVSRRRLWCAVWLAVATIAATPLVAALPAHSPEPHGWRGTALRAGLAVLLCLAVLALSLAAYRGAVQAGIVFADRLRSAFDLHRSRVLDAMGLQRPGDLDQEQAVWASLCAFLYRGSPPPPGALGYADPPPPTGSCSCPVHPPPRPSP
ncbi:hypothetical protein [Streptomyces sp. GbtcB7]|uniref:hypothetical protein n=1 Tax=Streptomyces sp. GbtcB7 TaxID=2824752 RepID=UPI001C2FBBC2|nr:hypothetical protein [Streptomyces sp. GbtcB7]